MGRRTYLHLLAWMQRRCRHPGGSVIADILDRDHPETQVQWCSICGAYGIGKPVVNPDGSFTWPEMRRPEPRWER